MVFKFYEHLKILKWSPTPSSHFLLFLFLFPSHITVPDSRDHTLLSYNFTLKVRLKDAFLNGISCVKGVCDSNDFHEKKSKLKKY